MSNSKSEKEKKQKYWVLVHAANRNSPVLNTVCKRAKKSHAFAFYFFFLSKNDGDNVSMLHCRKVSSEKLSIGTHWEICSLLLIPLAHTQKDQPIFIWDFRSEISLQTSDATVKFFFFFNVFPNRRRFLSFKYLSLSLLVSLGHYIMRNLYCLLSME